MKRFCMLAVVLLGLGCAADAQEFEGKPLVKATLIADTTAIVPGQPFTAGVLLDMEPDWHTYWQYPGDSGIPTQIHWNLPPGFKAGELEWPIPNKENDPGDLQVYTYSGQVLLMTQITPPATITGGNATLDATASWLVCKQACVPGQASLTLSLPVAATAERANGDLFDKYRGLLPNKQGLPFDMRWSQTATGLTARLQGLPEHASADFFPLPRTNMVLGHPEVSQNEEGTVVSVPITSARPWPRAIPGVVVTWPFSRVTARTGWETKGLATETREETGAAAPEAKGLAQEGLLTALFFGFLGGLILNLMPCVLPVIALKIFGFIKQAGEAPGRVFRLGMAFVAGIFTWFIALAILIVAFKAAGHELNWAFQFQNPYLVLGMSAIVFVFALNLFGVFEIILPGAAGGALVDLSQREGLSGAFFHGVFATLLATPCTAPFLGPALGFAFAAQPAVIFAVFGAIAFGMSLPYIILALRPGWIGFLPKPGVWMNQIKQFMGFLLLGTVIWLLWIVGQERGVDGFAWAAAFLLALGLACWIKGTFANPAMSSSSRIFGFVAILIVLAASFSYFICNKFASAQTSATELDAASSEGGIAWKAFTPAVLQQALAEDRLVFIDFTAAWCLSCKQNEILVLQSPAIRDAFKEHDVIALRGDWTNDDPAITKMLKQFGRAGVPLYVIYPAASPREPIVLPELLTKAIVLDGLEKGSAKRLSSLGAE